VGYSTIVIGESISAWGGQVSSFEISYPAYLEAMKNTRQTQTRNVTLYPFDINEINLATFFSQKFDVVFIDAQKSQYGAYMKKLQACLCPEHTIILDDVIKYQNKLTELYAFLSENQVNFEIFPMEAGDGVMKCSM